MRSACACSSSDARKLFIEPAAGVIARRASNVPMTSQKSRGLNVRIFASRSTTIASVGVCTRPTVVLKKPPSLELNAVIARVPLMPTSQSASLRLDRGVGERLHGFVARQRRKAVADGRGRHGLQPEPLDGLLRLRVADDVAENQFAFAPGVAGVDEFGHVLALDEFFERRAGGLRSSQSAPDRSAAE